MKRDLVLTTAATVALLATSPLVSQTGTQPAARTRAADTSSAATEAKEKAEDEALLGQLEQEGRSRERGKKPAQPGWVAGGGGGGGVGAGGGLGATFPVTTWIGRSASAQARPLVIRTSEPDPKAQATLEEDLTVMAHILDKEIDEVPGGKHQPVTALGIDVFFAPGSTPLRSLYLENYGAVFFLNVGFPLLAPPEKHTEEKPTADSVWEDARQELYGQRLEAAMPGEPAEEYSEEKVDRLKERLLAALKNASNIRDLKPEEYVTLWVSGGANTGAGRHRVARVRAEGGLANNALVTARQPGLPIRRTVMTMRVTKADIDGYAKGKLNAQEFRKRVRITVYAGDPTGGGADAVILGDYDAKHGL